jgi:hypothetical protein
MGATIDNIVDEVLFVTSDDNNNIYEVVRLNNYHFITQIYEKCKISYTQVIHTRDKMLFVERRGGLLICHP